VKICSGLAYYDCMTVGYQVNGAPIGWLLLEMVKLVRCVSRCSVSSTDAWWWRLRSLKSPRWLLCPMTGETPH
jgi:hypothetical protein